MKLVLLFIGLFLLLLATFGVSFLGLSLGWLGLAVIFSRELFSS